LYWRITLIFFGIFYILNNPLYSQNLIPDSSFEKNKVVPTEYSMISANNYWHSPTRGTPDLFCKCKNKKLAKISVVNVPKNGMGIQHPHSGNCYAGIFCVSHGFYREYLQTELSRPLEAGKDYLVRMHVSLSDYSSLTVDKIGFCFLDNPLKYDHSEHLTNLHPVYIPIEHEIYTDTAGWHLLEAVYRAKGGESIMLIGSFEIRRMRITGYPVPKGISSPMNRTFPRDAYYYFDDIGVFEIKPEPPDELYDLAPENELSEAPDTVRVFPLSPNEITYDTVLVFKTLQFETGKSTILPSSYKELNIILQKMKNDPLLKIEIFGHTDNTGKEHKNKLLSEERARAVANYFITNGIEDYRIVSVGFGSSKPIADNQTISGRKLNRRVEFVLFK
jgi:outer membrane protein OmpA-like peptidoglycan-associated protein